MVEDYLPTSENESEEKAEVAEMTQEEIDAAMPDEVAPAVTEDEIAEVAQFKEDEVVDCGGFAFEVTRVMGNNRYLIKVVA